MLGARRLYLAEGANPLKHWEQLATRMRSAARRSCTVQEWLTSLLRSLGIANPDGALSADVMRLQAEVIKVGSSAWLDMVEREHAYIIAMCQVEAEERRARRS